MQHERFDSGTVRSATDWADVTYLLGLDTLFERFADDAATRDVERIPIHSETVALKERGFGALRLDHPDRPALPLDAFFRLVRDLATADPNIAHVFRNHFFAVEQHRRTPEDPFSARVLQLARDGAMFGNAVSEAGSGPAGSVGWKPSARLDLVDGVQRISGSKIYSTGNMYADYLFGTALDPVTDEARQFFVATRAPGVDLADDWDGFGQKLTGSGTTVFDRVAVPPGDVYPLPARREGAPYLYGFTFHQIYLTTVISGIVNRILRDAVALIRRRGRNYYHALAEHPAREPELQSVVGRIAAQRAAIEAVTDRAVRALDRAWAQADKPEAAEQSAAASIAAAEAKVVTDEAAPALASLLIDVASGSGVTTARALDRHWRNIKVIAAHNPRVYKERILGDHYLNGTAPPTGAFF